MPEGRVQYVQHLTPERIWREQYLGHSNGVTSCARCSSSPMSAAGRGALGRFTGLLPQRDGDMAALEPQRGHVASHREALGKLLGDLPPAPALAGYALGCRHPEEFAARCSRAGLASRTRRSGSLSPLSAFHQPDSSLRRSGRASDFGRAQFAATIEDRHRTNRSLANHISDTERNAAEPRSNRSG